MSMLYDYPTAVRDRFKEALDARCLRYQALSTLTILLLY